MGNLCQMTPGREQIKYQTQILPPQNPQYHGYQQPVYLQPVYQQPVYQQYLHPQISSSKTNAEHQQNNLKEESILYNSWFDKKQGPSNLLLKPQQPGKFKMTDSVMLD